MNLFYTRPDSSLHLGVFPKPELVEIPVDHAPLFMQGLRALFISDVHLRRSVSDARLASLMNLIASQRADIILLGGDYAEGQDQCLRFFKAFQGVSASLGCYAVAGNNDTAERALLRKYMQDAGVTLLNNAFIRIPLPGGCLEIGGCDDHKYGSPHTSNLFTPDAYRILISHFPVRPDCTCELQLSGHTHGGQCNLLGVTPYSIGFEHRFRLLGVKGMHRIGDMRLLIGNGIGVSRFPFRLGATPEIYMLNFLDTATC